MTKFNFGVIKATFTHYLNESENLLAKEMFKDFMTLIKESKFLQAQFQVYKNLEEKYQPNENLAIKYIDDNIRTLSSFSREELIKENAKIFPLIEGLSIKVSKNKSELYENIHTMIFESLNGNKLTNVNKLHDAVSMILEHLKNNKPKLVENEFPALIGVPKDFLVKKAIQKFNEKYNSLNENEHKLFKTIISENKTEKSHFFDEIKTETLTVLKSLLGESTEIDERINESVEKIEKMTFKDETFNTDILSLHELKNSLL